MNTTMNLASTDPASQSQSVSADEALALAHVRKAKAFYIHLAQYAFVIASLLRLVPTLQDETADGWWARHKRAFCPPSESLQT